MALIERYVSTVEHGFSIVHLNKKDIFFYHYINSEDIEKCMSNKLYIGIKMNDVVSPSEIEAWMSDAVIVSDFAIEAVRARRTKGAKRCLVKQEDIAMILPGASITLFEVAIDQNFIKGEQNFHVFNPGNRTKIQPAGVLLYMPRKKSE
jgi:hypothetical protein